MKEIFKICLQLSVLRIVEQKELFLILHLGLRFAEVDVHIGRVGLNRLVFVFIKKFVETFYSFPIDVVSLLVLFHLLDEFLQKLLHSLSNDTKFSN